MGCRFLDAHEIWREKQSYRQKEFINCKESLNIYPVIAQKLGNDGGAQ